MKVLADAHALAQLELAMAARIGADIAASTGGAAWGLVGVRSHGDLLAKRIAARIGSAVEGRVGALDITMYRDDVSEIGASANVRPTEVNFKIDGLNIVLVDDVLMTGRSARAALQALMDLGRPRRIWLAVLIDRGGRELPIQADYVGLDLTNPDSDLHRIGSDQRVSVRMLPLDADDSIVVAPAPLKGGRHS